MQKTRMKHQEGGVPIGVAVNAYLRLLVSSIDVSFDPKFLPVRRVIRSVAKANNRTRVVLDTEDPEKGPRLLGSPGGYVTPSGEPVWHPTAYYRMRYRSSDEHLLVGALWACKNIRELTELVIRRTT